MRSCSNRSSLLVDSILKEKSDGRRTGELAKSVDSRQIGILLYHSFVMFKCGDNIIIFRSFQAVPLIRKELPYNSFAT